MKQLQKTILAVFVYHDIFDYPLKESEIKKFLIQIRNPKSEILNKFKCSNSQIQNSLKILQNKKRIFEKEDFYFLPGREKTVNLRKRREKYSQEKIEIVKNTIRILKFIPWIKMVGITGALAMHNSSKNDDIDFLVITAKNRLWLTRLLMVIVLEILGKRRRPNHKKIKDKICLNMFLDEIALSLSGDKQSLFTAHEIVQMKPAFNRDFTYERFLQANLWVRNYLPNGIKQTENTSEVKSSDTSEVEGEKKLLDFLEKLAYQFQLKYMKSKKTIEQISPHSAFFHPQDKGKEILREYEKK